MQARKIIKDLKYFTEDINYFPKKEIVTYDIYAESKEVLHQRVKVLNNIYENKAKVIVLTIESLMEKIAAPKELYNDKLDINSGQDYSLGEIKQKLINLGYERCELVEGNGQFSVRGGILDIHLVNSKLGTRIEFWGDTIDSIRTFDINSQRSIDMLDSIAIYPAQEFSGSATLLEYLSSDYLLFIDEIGKVGNRIQSITKDNIHIIKDLIEREKPVPGAIENMLDYEEFMDAISDRNIVYMESNNVGALR